MCVGPSPSQLPPREEGLHPFYDWLKAHNAEFDKVTVRTCTILCTHNTNIECQWMYNIQVHCTCYTCKLKAYLYMYTLLLYSYCMWLYACKFLLCLLCTCTCMCIPHMYMYICTHVYCMCTLHMYNVGRSGIIWRCGLWRQGQG